MKSKIELVMIVMLSGALLGSFSTTGAKSSDQPQKNMLADGAPPILPPGVMAEDLPPALPRPSASGIKVADGMPPILPPPVLADGMPPVLPGGRAKVIEGA